jgi:hypothetical protein
MLGKVEIDGRSIAFEHGLLLRRTESRPAESWHITLLRVPLGDMCWTEGRARQGCELLAETQRGERLSGRATLVVFASASDSLRLVGVSALRSV